MTQLKTISNNHLSLQCRCDHSKLVSVKELIGKLSLTTTIYEVARKAKCSHCGAIGVVDFRLHYVCKTKECLHGPKIFPLHFFSYSYHFSKSDDIWRRLGLWRLCPSSYKMGHRIDLSYGGSGSSVGLIMQPAFDVVSGVVGLSVF